MAFGSAYILATLQPSHTMDEEFSITLPSNVFSKEDPNNTPSKYVTRLNRTIQLSGEWEVAATRLQLQNSWYNIPKPQMLGVYVRDLRTLDDTYSAGDGLPSGITSATEPQSEKLFNRLVHKWKDATWANAFFKNMTYRCVTFPAGIYTSTEQVGRTLCELIDTAFGNSYNNFHLKYEYWPVSKAVVIQPNLYDDDVEVYVVRIVSLTNPADLDVMEALGFTTNVRGLVEGEKQYKFYGGIDLPTKQELATMSDAGIRNKTHIWGTKVENKPEIPEVRQLMLYADIAALRNVGNIEAQLLDTVVVTAKFGACEDALRGVMPNYVPVYRNTFSSIEIELTDHAGDLLRFTRSSTSPVIVTLRFRKVKSSSK